MAGRSPAHALLLASAPPPPCQKPSSCAAICNPISSAATARLLQLLLAVLSGTGAMPIKAWFWPQCGQNS
jgi:hypothetical protein